MDDYDDIFQVPEADSMPTNPAAFEAWDWLGCELAAEWERFWSQVGEHEREMQRKYGDRYAGFRRAEAMRAFRQRLVLTYGASELGDAWCRYDDDRRERLGMKPRTVFKTPAFAPRARLEHAEHAEHWADR